jgi:hypothetical protein
LIGHSLGTRVHARYTHVELPARREAIRKLELWKTRQEDSLKKLAAGEAGSGSAVGPGTIPQGHVRQHR